MTNPYDNRGNDWQDPNPPTQQFPPQSPGPYQYGAQDQSQWNHYAPHQAPPQQDWNYTNQWGQEPEQKKSKAPIYILAGVVGAIVLGAGAFFVYTGTGGGTGEPQTQTIVVTSTSQRPSSSAAPAPSAHPTRPVETTSEKPRTFGAGEPRTSLTSDRFAKAVGEDFAAYYRENKKPPTHLNTYSPVTKQYYDMSCQPASGGFTCSGGNNAVVFIPEE